MKKIKKGETGKKRIQRKVSFLGWGIKRNNLVGRYFKERIERWDKVRRKNSLARIDRYKRSNFNNYDDDVIQKFHQERDRNLISWSERGIEINLNRQRRFALMSKMSFS